ncbi:GlxA family transcriptional regulator [Amycolatopsis pithecellobii]|uniref:Helix-turn-helix domain-containing protein n=1 Tax=Amycolatopsis pithecellobii TaxID=664692 RepID=A0A6N7YWW0_9PSEU|nr:helix-turn-helix domain-containing protein [Amycolatopsis pithecellobii]MTD57555.1 helix-turn-helix domain-containing protein [Amycolatopsis pithecellobii]
MHTVVVLAVPDAIVFDLATPIEVFGRARLPGGQPAYRVLVAGSEPEVAAGPVRLGVDDGLETVDRADTIVVPGRTNPELETPAEFVSALRKAFANGTRVASICVGTFTLAEAGLLDGLRATTHWRAASLLRRKYPTVEVDPDVLYIDNGQVLTSAGATAGIDLCLYLIRRDYGAAVAADAARLAVAPLHRSGGQAQFRMPSLSDGTATSLEHVFAWLEENAHRELTLADIAAAAHVSVRTLSRRFQQEAGCTPLEWLIGVRVRHAQELLESTDHPVERIAAQVGFPSSSNFRARFRAYTTVSPSAYRATFRSTSR